jgi:hypothetical protein
MTRVVPAASVALWLLAISIAVSGCSVFECGYTATKEWDEPGLYNRFPPAGEMNGYTIQHVDRPNGALSSRQAFDKDNVHYLSVNERDQVLYVANSKRPLEHAMTAVAFNATFDALGLPHPARTTADLSWGKNPC